MSGESITNLKNKDILNVIGGELSNLQIYSQDHLTILSYPHFSNNQEILKTLGGELSNLQIYVENELDIFSDMIFNNNRDILKSFAGELSNLQIYSNNTLDKYAGNLYDNNKDVLKTIGGEFVNINILSKNIIFQIEMSSLINKNILENLSVISNSFINSGNKIREASIIQFTKNHNIFKLLGSTLSNALLLNNNKLHKQLTFKSQKIIAINRRIGGEISNIYKGFIHNIVTNTIGFNTHHLYN